MGRCRSRLCLMLIISGSDVDGINLLVPKEGIERTIKFGNSGFRGKVLGSFRAAAIHSVNFGIGLSIDGINHPAFSNVAGADDAPFYYLGFIHLRILLLARVPSCSSHA